MVKSNNALFVGVGSMSKARENVYTMLEGHNQWGYRQRPCRYSSTMMYSVLLQACVVMYMYSWCTVYFDVALNSLAALITLLCGGCMVMISIGAGDSSCVAQIHRPGLLLLVLGLM